MAVNGYIGGPLISLLGGIVHEIIQRTNTIDGATADIKSNINGVIGSLNVFGSCEKYCECEKSKNNPI